MTDPAPEQHVSRVIWTYIKSDLTRYAGGYSHRALIVNLLTNRSFIYSFWLRMTRHPNVALRVLAIAMHRILSDRYLIQIPRRTRIGYGLYLGHHMCVIVSPSAVIGNNVNLSQFTTIGSNSGNAARIGDNVYIGPGVSIVENVVIGDNVTIGAGSIVTRDIPENATAAGNPAKVLNFDRPGRFVVKRWAVIP